MGTPLLPTPMRPSRLLLPLLLPLLLAGPGAAQSPVWVTAGGAAGEQLGSALVTTDDLDGDGLADLLAGAPRSSSAGSSSGSVLALSGASGALIYRIDGAAPSELFGSSLAALEDVDADGIADWLVGIPFASQGAARVGRAEVRSGADGSLLRTHWGLEAFGLLGDAVAALGDLDGDGVGDYLIAAPQVDVNGMDAGQVEVRSGATGFLIRNHDGAGPGERLGSALCGLGDLDGDGRADFALGAPGAGGGAGEVRLLSGASGALLHTVLPDPTGGPIGDVLASISDRTGDGRLELAVGSPGDPTGGPDAGAVLLVDTALGTVLPPGLLGAPGERLGATLLEPGDWNGDGLADLAVRLEAGGVRIYSGAAPGTTVLGEVGPAPSSGAPGTSLAGALDLDGDGRTELVLGDPLDSLAGSAAGTVRCFSSEDLLGTPFCTGADSGASCPCGNAGAADEGCANSTGAGALLAGAGTASASADDLLLLASGLLPSRPALLFAGGSSTGGTGILLGDGLRCAGAPIERIGVRLPDAQGEATWGPGLTQQQGWSAGQTWRFQVWYRDASPSPCGSDFNLSAGYRVLLTP